MLTFSQIFSQNVKKKKKKKFYSDLDTIITAKA